MTFWQQVILIVCGQGITFLFTIWFFRFRKRENVPDELCNDIEQIRDDISIMGQRVARIEGHLGMNGPARRSTH